MTSLTLAQQSAIIATMPRQHMAAADESLFRAIAVALCGMPTRSLIACLVRGFSDRDLTITPVDASRIARALAAAEEGTPFGLGAILAAQAERMRSPVLA